MKGNQYFSHYFQHDYNARSDPKLQEVMIEHGAAGLGVYWCIIEQMYEQGGTLPLRSCKSIAFALHVDIQMVESIINDFDLFVKDEELFWSPSILRRLSERESISQKRKDAAIKRWESNAVMQKQCKSNASALQTECKCNAIKGNKRKEKEIKVDNIDDKSSYCQGQEEVVPDKEKKSDKKPEIEVTPQEVVDVWNRVIKETGAPIRCKDSYLTDLQKQKIRLRIGEMKMIGPPLEVFETVVRKACASNFCCGGSDRGWLLKFDWVFQNSNNWHKIYQGDYDDRNRKGGSYGSVGLHVTATRPEDFEGAF